MNELLNELNKNRFYEVKDLIRMYDCMFVTNGLYKENEGGGGEVDDPPSDYNRYRIEDILEDVFIEQEKIEDIIFNMKYKKNIILQGPPGVGKTFVAKEALLSSSRLQM